MNTATSHIRHSGLKLTAAQQIGAARRAACANSLMRFARTYLSAHFKLPPSPMHEQIVELLEDATTTRNLRAAIAAPRGHAKSTLVSLAYVLWCICYRKEHFILLVSNTLDQAVEALAHVKNELESNPRLIADFPNPRPRNSRGQKELSGGGDGFGGGSSSGGGGGSGGGGSGGGGWRREEIVVGGSGATVKVVAMGTGTKIRGRRHRQHRPTLIILDDVENEEEVRSADQRRHKADWFNRSVLKAGDAQTNVLVIGTVLHYDALLFNLIGEHKTAPGGPKRKAPGWVGRKYQAVLSFAGNTELWAQWESIYCFQEEYHGQCGPQAARAFYDGRQEPMLEGAGVLWPELDSYYDLMVMRVREGRWAFDSEKQNEPVNPDDCYFQEQEFHFWDDTHESAEALIEAIGDDGVFAGACDPSLGRQGRGADDSAIVSLLKDKRTGFLYVVDADVRRRRPDAIIRDVIEYHRLRGYERFGMETNQFQSLLADQLRERSRQAGVHVPVRDINHTHDKLGRIQHLQPLVTSGTLRFSRRHVALLEQLRQFPHAAHDDGPDALEMAVEVARSCGYDDSGGRFNV